MARRRRVG